MKHSKTIDTAAIARLLRHEDEHGMGRVFMYAFLNEVIRQKRPFSFDCESAQVIDKPGLLVVDKVGRSITIKHKRDNCLSGESAASGSSSIYKPLSENLFFTKFRNDSPCEHECKSSPP